MAENIADDGVKKENRKKSSKKLHAEVAKAAEEERKRCFLLAIASFFEKSGLSKSRESLLNEAQLEVAGLKVQLFDLEDVFYKFIESSSKDSPKETIMSADKHENMKEPSALSNRVQEHSKEAKRKRKHFSNSNRESQQEIVPGRVHDECPLDDQVHDVKGSNTESESKRKKIKLGMLETKSEDFTHCNTTSEQPDHSNIALKDKKKKNHTCDFEIPEGNKNQVGSKKIQEPLSHIEPDMTTDKETKSRKKKKNSKTTSECFDSKIGENLDRSSYTNMNNKNSSVPENGDSTKSTFENVKDSISQNATNSKNENIEKKVKSEEVQSVEPKSISPFQRIKIDEVKFANEKLQDNSYWAKGGADNGYGAKAQEVLGQVRGRDFRHEKTKKKRGSYRGGQIDLQSHSIKFNYSDEE